MKLTLWHGLWVGEGMWRYFLGGSEVDSADEGVDTSSINAFSFLIELMI